MTDTAQRTILSRLLTALREEELLTDYSVVDSIAPDADPVAVLEAVRPVLAVPATNFERTALELADSVVGLARARAGVARRYAGRTELGNLEQIICEGHPKHPCAKTTLGLGPGFAQVLPEQVESFALPFLAVRETIAEHSGISVIAAFKEHIPGLAARLLAEVPPGFVVVPVHPWQLANVVQLSDDIRLLETTARAEPLMSVRTLRVSDETGCVHIKTSVSFQLTGAIRGISRAALAGPIIAGEALAAIRRRGIAPYTVDDTPAFTVGHDLAGVRVSDELGAIVRAEPEGIPVAALMATNPITGKLLFHEVLAESGVTAAEWFGRLAHILITPALELAEYGLALEPHPQNTVLKLRDGMPYAVTVRDFGGCRIVADSPFYRQRDWGFLADTALICADYDTARAKLIYPMISNLILGLCDAAGIDPADIEIDGLAHRLPRKRVLGMRLSGAVTEQDYVWFDNPISMPPRIDETEWARQHVRSRLAAAKEMEQVAEDPNAEDIDNAIATLAQVKQVVEKRRRNLPVVPVDFVGVLADSLTITGHNVHPLAKLRRGFSPEDSRLYGPENFRVTHLKLIGVPVGMLNETGDVTAILRREFPDLVPDTPLRIVPVHPWQWEHIIAPQFGEKVVDFGVTLPVLPTISMRTALTYHRGTSGKRLYIKTSIDVVLTSTRRSMSADSALGTPKVADYIARLLARTNPAVTVLPEIAGCAYRGVIFDPRISRSLSTLIRSADIGSATVAISATALRNEAPPEGYVRDLLETVLPTMWNHGIALEAHLQNALLLFDDTGTYTGLGLRDFSGLRALKERATDIPLEEGAVTLTEDHAEFCNKGYYATFLGNLAGFPCDWDRIRMIVDELIATHNPPQEDIDALLSPTIKQKAFVRMSLDPQAGDIYVDIPNPLVPAEQPTAD